MKTAFRFVLILFTASTLVSACGLSGLGGKTVTVSIVYGSEKQEWLEPLVEEYNQAKHKTEEGSVIVVEATPIGSVESAQGIISGEMQPTVWSPASSIYVPVAAAEWRQKHSTDLFTGTPNDLVLSPVVIAM